MQKMIRLLMHVPKFGPRETETCLMHERLEKPNGNLGIGRARLDVFEHTRRRNHAHRALRVALRKDAQAFLGRVAQNRPRKLKDELCVLLER